MYRWSVKHGRLVMVLWSFPVSIVFLYMFNDIGISLIYWALFVVLITCTAWGFVLSCADKILKKAIKSLDDECDPYPLLDAANELLLNSKLKKTYKEVFLINKAFALREIGEVDRCFEILYNLNIDQYPSMPIHKLIYYINLSDTYMKLNKIVEAELLLNKAHQILRDAKLGKQKRVYFERICRFNHFQIDFVKGKYDGLEEFLLANSKEALSKRFLVSNNLATAELYIKENKSGQAKEHLQFVIENGNKLHNVEKAKNLICLNYK